jgi:transcriptional regulator with XRE-family HTH domain
MVVWKELDNPERYDTVAAMKASGMRTREIAEALGTSYHSITGYSYRIKKGDRPRGRILSKSPHKIIREIFAEADRLRMGTKQLAYRSGYNQTTVAYIRQGRTKNPTIAVVRDLGEAVGLEITLTKKVKE